MASLDVNKNYNFEDGIAYTEDEIPVHKLFVREISSTAKDEDVLDYFSQFGEVVKMCVKPKRKRELNNDSKSVTIHYADAHVAAKVLLERTHILEKRILVSPCHSWEQPGAFKSNNDEEIEATAQNSDDLGACVGATTAQPAPPLNILNLNDDCLEHVAKFLKIDEQVRMARTCTRFRGAVEMRVRVEHKSVNLDKFEDMTLWDIREFFLTAGPKVETIISHFPLIDYKNSVAELISNNCPNIKFIYLCWGSLNAITLRRLVENMNNITKLHLNECNLSDTAVMAIKNLSKLQELSLAGNTRVTGKYLSELTKVRNLNLGGCSNIQTENFIEIVKSMKELSSLNIEMCLRLSIDAFQEMEKHCANLVILQMTCLEIPYGGSVARLPSIERLELVGSNPVDGALFTQLEEHKSKQLEYLKITSLNCIDLRRAARIAQFSHLKVLVFDSNENLNDDCLYQFGQLKQLEEIGLHGCIHFTNGGLLNLVRRCTKLKIVDFQYCRQINKDFIFGAIDMLEKRQQGLPANPEKKPIWMYVHKSGVKKSLIMDPRYKNALTLLHALYHWRETSIGSDALDYWEEIEESNDEDDEDVDLARNGV